VVGMNNNELCFYLSYLTETEQQNTSAKAYKQSKGSAGNAFYVIAGYLLECGYFICGAAWTKDFQVQHIISRDIADIIKMCGYKCIESNMEPVTEEIQTLLASGKKVLFAGTPCQVQRIKNICKDTLKPECNNLLTIDSECTGIASAESWNEYLNEKSNGKSCEKSISDRIVNVDFDYKKCRQDGAYSRLELKYASGDTYIGDDRSDLFLWKNRYGLNNSSKCYGCRCAAFAQSDIMQSDVAQGGIVQSDITLRRTEAFNEKRYLYPENAVTVAIPHTKAGIELLLSVLDRFSWYGSVTDKDDRSRDSYRQYSNMQMAKKLLSSDIYRERFYSCSSEKMRYDVVLVAMWSPNYGNAMTNYALYNLLKSMGYSVLALMQTVGVPVHQWDIPGGLFLKFALEQYDLSLMHIEEFSDVNSVSDSFILGCDQVWNYKFYGQPNSSISYYYMEFINDDKKKITYASSFGSMDSIPPASENERVSRLLRRMNHISVRESFGVDVCRKYGAEAVHVLDPVLLLDKEYYIRLVGGAEGSGSTEDIEVAGQNVAAGNTVEVGQNVITAYILNQTKEKALFIREIERELNAKAVIMLDAGAKPNYEIWEKEDILISQTEVKDWVSRMYSAEYIITDSYHGACFAMIFRKKFIAFVNRQTERFETLKSMPEISGHIADINKPDAFKEILMRDIDYNIVEEWLSYKKEESKNWLIRAIRE